MKMQGTQGKPHNFLVQLSKIRSVRRPYLRTPNRKLSRKFISVASPTCLPSIVSTQTKSTLPVMKGRFPEPPRFDSTIVTCPPDKGNDVLAMFFSTEQQGDEKIKNIDDTFHTPKLHSYVRTWYVFYVANDSIKQISVFCSMIHFPTTTHCPTAYCSADYCYTVYRSTKYRFIILPTDVLPSTDHPITVLPSTVLPTDVLPSTDHPITVLPSTVLPTDVLPSTDHRPTV
jgi:hypothetical protein